MNSKVIGSFLILGPLLLVIPWFTLGVDVSGMSPSEHIAAVLEKSGQSEASGILNVFGAIFFFTGLYYLSKSLKSDDGISNSLAALGGLLIILCLPMFATLVGAEVIAISEAKRFGNDVGAAVLSASTASQILSFIDIVSDGAAGEVVSIIGWMGFFLMTLVTGILTLVPALKK